MNTKLVKVGFEIEGEFSTTLHRWLADKGVMKGDGSLRSCGSAHQTPLSCAEYNSPVYAATPAGLKSIKKFFDELDAYYKANHFHYNQSCGFHIHVSFNQFPAECFSKQFVNYFLKALKTKQKRVIEKRSGNRYCQLKIPTRELERGSGDRYRFVNLWPAYERHGTIEFRIYPTDNPKRMYRYIVFTLAQVRKFLTANIKVRNKIKFKMGVAETREYRESCDIPRESLNHTARIASSQLTSNHSF